MVDFIHRPYQKGETIAALATPEGEGGIAIIRISGDEACVVAERLFSKKITQLPSHTVHFGYVLDGEERIDEALLLVMHAPRSYTGENTVEVQCHGGRVAAKRVLERAIQCGARPAQPGEFTFKAFMNGKLDLTQAEAVQELIKARSDASFSIAQTHLEGALSQMIAAFQKELTQIAAILEAWVDFPEEGLEFMREEELLADLRALMQRMQHLLTTFEEGQKIHSGIALALVGPPNAGKSSLLNALLRKERAIVTPIAGTTRDLVQEEISIGGRLFHLTDTAGIRESAECIEKEGIRRSRVMIEKSDLTLLVLDVTEKVETFDLDPRKTLLVWNKCDLPHRIPSTPFSSVKISAKEGRGLDALREEILVRVERTTPSSKEVLLTNQRHYTALHKAHQALERLEEGLCTSLSPEFLTLEVRLALNALGEIIGTDVGEEILSSIFSTFCIGK